MFWVLDLFYVSRVFGWVGLLFDVCVVFWVRFCLGLVGWCEFVVVGLGLFV